MRLSIGIEDVEDLIADLEQALAAAEVLESQPLEFTGASSRCAGAIAIFRSVTLLSRWMGVQDRPVQPRSELSPGPPTARASACSRGPPLLGHAGVQARLHARELAFGRERSSNATRKRPAAWRTSSRSSDSKTPPDRRLLGRANVARGASSPTSSSTSTSRGLRSRAPWRPEDRPCGACAVPRGQWSDSHPLRPSDDLRALAAVAELVPDDPVNGGEREVGASASTRAASSSV